MDLSGRHTLKLKFIDFKICFLFFFLQNNCIEIEEFNYLSNELSQTQIGLVQLSQTCTQSHKNAFKVLSS